MNMLSQKRFNEKICRKCKRMRNCTRRLRSAAKQLRMLCRKTRDLICLVKGHETEVVFTLLLNA